MSRTAEVATLCGSLLARKGNAKPAAIEPPAVPSWVRDAEAGPRDSFATAQRQHLGGDSANDGNSRPKVRSSEEGNGRQRLTLRLDEDHRRRLRLTAAHLDCSMQNVMLLALDAFCLQVKPSTSDQSCPCMFGTKAS